MRLKIRFWEDISIRLKNTYVLKTHPSTWKKSEVISFLEHFEKQVTAYRLENDIEPATNVSVSYDTIRRILIKKEYKGSDYTRDLFAQYFGERSYLDYIERFEDPETAVPIAIKSKSKLRSYILGAIGLIAILTGSLYSNSFLEGKSECLKIEELVKEAIATEFAAYRSIPNTDPSLESLKDYFLEDQAAYKRIKRVLHNEKIRKWVLTNENNISAAELLEFECNYIDSNLASVNTKEHWVINWYDTKINEYAYLYDTINTQTYYLKKINDRWKVTINDYDTNKDRVFVKIFEDKDFDKTLSVEQIKNSIVKFMANGDTQSALWYLLKCSEKFAPHISQEVILLNGNLQKNVRRVNTREIDLPTYHTLNKEIGSKIFDLLKQV